MGEFINQPKATETKAAPGAWQDITARLKRGEREMILAVSACGIAVIQFFIGATGGSLLTAAMFFNLAFIGWLANTAFARRRAGEGSGLLVLTCVAFVLAALSTWYLVEGLTALINTIDAFEHMDF